MKTSEQKAVRRREAGENIWFEGTSSVGLPISPTEPFSYTVLKDEKAVGERMLDELIEYSKTAHGDIVIVLLGGRGAQAMYKIIAELAKTGGIDGLLGRLHVFTQDALAPMNAGNRLSFVRDFERLLGDDFFRKIKSFTSMQTTGDDVESTLISYVQKIESLGGIDIFFLGLGPETNAASHLCYIKPNSGARFNDLAGMIPISESILDHHISKFKAGGSVISEADEAECRNATHILTLGPAMILRAKKIVQSIVDASTAPAKRESFRRLLDTQFSADEGERERQLDENPGLWIRLHPNVASFVLPDLIGVDV
jgi:6-phosphogluconolactonase/glucosamine-6-phosphate isomerase/deaminase